MAAGQGFKTFTTGEVLTAGDVNGYLMQGILVFASEAARNSAITSPQEGQFAFTKDNNSLWYYTGSAWAASGATGDIEGVTAGVGISGGGTSGTVTITNSMATEISAKGDLVVGTGSQTFDNLTVGANNTVLTADSSTATGLKWATPAGGGKVLQVVQGTYSSEALTTSTSFVDTGLTVSITPTASTSKILVLVNAAAGGRSDGSAGVSARYKLLRGSTEILNILDRGLFNNATQFLLGIPISATYLDSPATTSSTTYKVQQSSSNGTQIGINYYATNAVTSTIVVMEIGA